MKIKEILLSVIIFASATSLFAGAPTATTPTAFLVIFNEIQPTGNDAGTFILGTFQTTGYPQAYFHVKSKNQFAAILAAIASGKGPQFTVIVQGCNISDNNNSWPDTQITTAFYDLLNIKIPM